MSRKPSRLLIRRRRRAARKAEHYIAEYVFPPHIEPRVRRRAELDEPGWLQVERGLREWFICFCETAFGEYLHHTPDEAMTMSAPMPDALAETVRALDRSEARKAGDSVLWDLDERLGARKPLGLSNVQIVAARSRASYPVAGGS